MYTTRIWNDSNRTLFEMEHEHAAYCEEAAVRWYLAQTYKTLRTDADVSNDVMRYINKTLRNDSGQIAYWQLKKKGLSF